jgi:hypothetical protein
LKLSAFQLLRLRQVLPCFAACLRPSGDFMRDFSTKLVPLLEDDIRVMIYAGRFYSAAGLAASVDVLLPAMHGNSTAELLGCSGRQPGVDALGEQHLAKACPGKNCTVPDGSAWHCHQSHTCAGQLLPQWHLQLFWWGHGWRCCCMHLHTYTCCPMVIPAGY